VFTGTMTGARLMRATRTVYAFDLPGHESNASLRYCLIRHVGSYLLAAYDVGQ
jgi:hypothetical protein